MRVKCINFDKPGNSWLKKNKEYQVIGIYIRDQHVEYRIWSDEIEVPAIFLEDLFEIIDAIVPENWLFKRIHASKTIAIEPAPWSKPNFWDEFFNGEREAHMIFNSELQKMLT